MRRTLLAPVLGLALTMAACGGTTTALKAHQLEKNPQFRQQEARVQKDVRYCVSHAGLKKQAFLHCMVPGGQAKAENCVQRDISKDGFLTHHQRQNLVLDLTKCGLR